MWQNRNDHKQEIPSVSASSLVWVPDCLYFSETMVREAIQWFSHSLICPVQIPAFWHFSFFLMLRYSFILECNINKWLLDFFKERSLLVKIKWHIYVCSFHWLLFQIPQSLEITEWLIFKFSYSFGNLIF